MGAKTGLAVFLASLGDAFESVGDRNQSQQDMQQQIQIKQGLEQMNRPREEEEYKRKLLMGLGIDPDSKQPIPGFYEAKQKLRSIVKSGRGGRGRGSSSSSDDLF